jgi:hypothetical protein
MTKIDIKIEPLILPKLINLSDNLKLTPLQKSSIKTILKLQEEITTPKQQKLKLKEKINENPKSTNSTNYVYSPRSITNEYLTERLKEQKIKMNTITFPEERKTTKTKSKKKYYKILNTNYPIKLKKFKPKIKRNIINTPIKLLTKSTLNLRNSGRNLLYSKTTETEQTKYTITTKNLISEFTPIDTKIHDEEDLEDEIEYEKYDSFPDRNLEETYILKVVTDFLRSKDNKLNQISTAQEIFYNSFENRINFIFDIIGVPCFKNHFIKLNATKESVMNNISNNLVETGIHYYLNKLRVKYQRQFDEREEKKKLELLKEKNYNKQKSKKEKEKMYEFENAEQAFKEVIPKTKVIEINKEIDYDTEDYFSLKLIRFENVKIADSKEKNSIFKYIKQKKSKYRDSILKQFVNNDD